MKSNFAFLEDTFPSLANFGKLAEKYCYSDSNSCLIKLGMIGETIVNLMFKFDKISPPIEYDKNKQDLKINTLLNEGLLPYEIVNILHILRKNRNKATHEGYGNIERGKSLIVMAYGLCEWFMQVYGKYDYEHIDFDKNVFDYYRDNTFTEPKEERKQKEEKIEKELVIKEEEKAINSEKLDREERKKKARRFASQLIRSEEETRLIIDQQLRDVGWEVDTKNICYSKGTRPQRGKNLAIAEWPTNNGYVDYALFIDDNLIGTIEAKAESKNIYSVIDNQCKDYSKNINVAENSVKYKIENNHIKYKNYGEYKVPFTFATNGRPYLKQLETKSGIYFLDLRKSNNIPKPLNGWPSPLNLKELLSVNIEEANKKLQSMSDDFLTDKDGLNLRNYQIEAIKSVEQAVIDGKNRILLAMATGTGKTRTALGMIYCFLKSGRFKRILFLVDRTALGQQAEDVFKDVKIEDLKPLNKIYNIHALTLQEKFNLNLSKETKLHISTVQSLVKSIDFYNDDEDRKKPAVFDYDLIIIDEAHRGYTLDREMSEEELLYRNQDDFQSKYKKAIDYFNSVCIGLTATPAKHTTAIFGLPVYNYTYKQAVIDGNLVDYNEPYRIKTKLSLEGIHYKRDDIVTVINKKTGETKTCKLDELEDEILDYDVDDFNKNIITDDFTRTVLEYISKKIDPQNPQKGKTLIYAVNDLHADSIVRLLREIYAKNNLDNEAIMKITGKSFDGNRDKIQQLIKKFKNEDYPNIAVTVDLLTTGIDVPEITNLVFMRSIKSRILFEQMIGRATRKCDKINKDHFEVYDPIGIFEKLESYNNMVPIVADPNTTLTILLDGLEAMDTDDQLENQVNQIIAKLNRKIFCKDEDFIKEFKNITGKDIKDFVSDLRNVKPAEATKTLIKNIEILKKLDEIKNSQNSNIIISTKNDVITSVERDSVRPEDYLESFIKYINENKDEEMALNIVCTRPRDLTKQELKSLESKLDLMGFNLTKLNNAISDSTSKKITSDIINIIRHYTNKSLLMDKDERISNAIEKLKKLHIFSKKELNWIDRIEKRLKNDTVFNLLSLNEEPFKGSEINKLFGDRLKEIIDELNVYLYDDFGGQTA